MVDPLDREPKQADKLCTNIPNETFFNSFLQLPPRRLEEIRRHLENKGHYAHNRWSYFPLADDNRLANHTVILYRSFVGLGNAIDKYVRTQNWVESDRIEGRWVACQLDYEGQFGPPPPNLIIPPCCSFIPDDITDKFLDEWVHELTNFGRSTTSESRESRWGSIATTVDIRSLNTPAIWERSVQQLYDSAHRILYNQRNRQFVIGLILCANMFKVFVIDRSGIIGLSDMIDVHQDPNSLIQALAAFSLFPRQKLGFGKYTGKQKAESSIYPYENFTLGVSKNPNPPYCDYPKRTAKLVRSRPLSQFKDLRELLLGMRNAVQAHQRAYENGVLHSNITADSIIFQDEIVQLKES